MSTIAYIDGQNFLYGASTRLIESGVISDKQDLSTIDIPFLLNTALKNPQHKIGEIKYYGVSRIKRQEDYGETMLEKSIKFSDNLRRLKSYLAKTGVEYINCGQLRPRNTDQCKRCGAIDFKFQEKGVDVALAVDIVRDVLKGKTDHIILVSSDTDLLPAIRIAKKEGAKITYIPFDKKIIRALSVLAESTIVLNTYDIAEAYARSLK